MGRPLGLFLFLGADRAKKFQRIQELERALQVSPFDRHHVDGGMVAAEALAALCRQRPAASPARLIVVDDAHRLDGSAVQALLDHAQAIAQVACVILLVEVELSVRHPVARAAAQMATERFTEREAPSVKPFALVEALGRRDLPGALQSLQDQAAVGQEPLKLVGLVAWQLQRWLVVRRLLETGASTRQIAGMTGWQPWQIERASTEVSARTAEAIGEALRRCWELDTGAKQGRVLPWMAVEQLVMELCVGGTTPNHPAWPRGGGGA